MAGAESRPHRSLGGQYAEEWPVWGYRNIAALMRADRHEMTNSTVAHTVSHRERRQRIMKRADHRCEIRYPGICTDHATVIDHTTALGLGGTDDDSIAQ